MADGADADTLSTPRKILKGISPDQLAKTSMNSEPRDTDGMY
jgi:hypothetical protein